MHTIVKFVEQVPAWFADLYASLVGLVAAHLYPVVLVSAALVALGTYGLGRATGRRDQHAADKAAMGDSYDHGYTDGVTKEHDVTEDAAGQRHVCADGVLREAAWSDCGMAADDGLTFKPVAMDVTRMELGEDGALIVEGTYGGQTTRAVIPFVERAQFAYSVGGGGKFSALAGVRHGFDIFTEEAARAAVNAWNADRNMVDE
jgi:hypothetical protein